jgi:sulfoxide reductase catalytic subunit YedY
VYMNRRRFMKGAGVTMGSAAISGLSFAEAHGGALPIGGPIPGGAPGYSKLGKKDELTHPTAITTYNNFYEFGTDKGDTSKHGHKLRPRPWQVTVDGLCAKPGTLDLDDFLKPHAFEQRVYRMRCVEAWSMVIPWVGISLGDVVKRFAPLGSAKYVRFETIFRPKEMRGQRRSRNLTDRFGVPQQILPWPYEEGLRLDEAVNPLAILAVGLYGEVLPNQNGAPLRLVVPWKYGFKSIKSIVRITFTEEEPKTSWQNMNAREYGFYANFNSTIPHPRWSQAIERRIGDLLRRDTLMFNGYEEEVSHLYADMDLAKSY